MEGEETEQVSGDIAEAGKYEAHSSRRSSDKHSSGYESERDMDITSSQSGSWDSRRSSLALVSECPVEESQIPARVFASHFSPRDPMPGTSKLTKNGEKIGDAEGIERLADISGGEVHYIMTRSPLQSRRFSQIHSSCSKMYHHHKPRSKDDSDLIIHKERSVLLTSRGRELKMLQTEFHKKRPHLWKHSSSWSQSFRHQCPVADLPALSDLPSSKDSSPRQPRSAGISPLSSEDLGEKGDSSVETPTTIKTEPSGTDEEMKSLSPDHNTRHESADIKPSVPIVTVHTPECSIHYPRSRQTKTPERQWSENLSKHVNFKKFLQHRYLSSLQDSVSTEDDTSFDSGADTHEGSVEREIYQHSGISIEVDKPDDEDDDDDCVIVDSGDQTKEDNEVFTLVDIKQQQLSQRLARQRLSAYRQEQPLDLSSQQDINTPGSNISQTLCYEQYSDELYLSAAQTSPHLSPTMFYQRNLPVFYSPKQELLSPRSPLWSVPEGHVFNFSVPNSPFDTRPHSDPEFVSTGYSPAFSPDSPVQFTFPSKAADISKDGRMPKSPRLMFSKNKAHSSPSKQLSKLFRSPPTADQLLSSESLATGQPSYVCPICGQVFPTYDNLAKHMAKHLPTETVKSADNNKIHYCRICERSFSRSDMLTRHMRLHTGLKPYECRVCGQVFSRSDHLNTHQRTHTGVKPYRCPQCPYAACRRDMITRHMRIHTKRSGKRGECSDDGKAATSPKYLSVHDPDVSELRKSSASSVDSLRPQTCSISSVDSLESDTGSRKHSLTSLDSIEQEQRLLSFQRSSTESTDLDEGISGVGRGQSSHPTLPQDTKYLDPYSSYRNSRHWSVTSTDSIESENPRSEMENPRLTSSSSIDPVLGDQSMDVAVGYTDPILEHDIAQKFNIND